LTLHSELTPMPRSSVLEHAEVHGWRTRVGADPDRLDPHLHLQRLRLDGRREPLVCNQRGVDAPREFSVSEVIGLALDDVRRAT